MVWKDGIRAASLRAYEWIAYRRGNGYYRRGAAKYGAIFIHIPKTGGMSVIRVVGSSGKTHHTAMDYRRANPSKFSKSFKFAFTRNPWDRVVSAFQFLVHEGTSDTEEGWRGEVRRQARAAPGTARTFEEFAIERLPLCMDELHFRPQHTFIWDERDLMDFTGRFERLSEDFSYVAGILGISAELPHVNASRRRDWRAYYTTDTYNLVGDLYRTDIELFGY